ncbi:MAG: tripartite tricarboxylate transporter substrate binding protein [Rhodoferax sp.]|nr:tripartite tricarboxylate transporter substrate binding protein [Rhodoferax sp.]
MRLMHLWRCSALALAAFACGPSFSQAWPAKPVKIVTAFGPGSASDIVARLLARELQSEYGQPFIVENKPGASGIIAAEFVARSTADGYTLLLTTNTINSGNPHLFKKLPYDPIRDFTPVARVCNFLFILVVSADQPIKTVSDLESFAKAHPNKVSFAYGNSTGQVAGAAFNALAGLNALAVPYKSTPQALSALVGGEVTYLFVDLASSQSLEKAGRVRALAITTENKSPLAPELPTLASSADLPGFDLAAWVGVVGPAALPGDITNKLSASINRILRRKEVVDKLTSLGADVSPGTAAELQSYMSRQYVVWGDKIKAAGIQPE